jgi:hypothetical protein
VFSFIKKKSGKYPTESKWSMLKGQNQGKPMLIRRNDSAKQLSSNSDFEYRFGVAIPLLNPNDLGLPSNEETEILNQIEDELCLQFEKDQVSILALAITTSGMREFVFYSRDTQEVEQKLKTIQEKFPAHEIQHYVEKDPKWILYKQFA